MGSLLRACTISKFGLSTLKLVGCTYQPMNIIEDVRWDDELLLPFLFRRRDDEGLLNRIGEWSQSVYSFPLSLSLSAINQSMNRSKYRQTDRQNRQRGP